jgi:uncharacterized protein (DUF924 family)
MNERRASEPAADALLRFWFGEAEVYGQSRAQWFGKAAAFDGQCRQRFLADYEQAARGELAHWQDDPANCLALIILLDQLPRNMFRDQARAFASDPLALAATRHALAVGHDRGRLPVERQFFYLPLEHSEMLADQVRCLELMNSLADCPETRELHRWAQKHLEIIERFGRFPHRNALLGRISSAEEIAFLQQPGSRF